ncbi:MAG: 30S ribosomal protein S3, partial [Bryobacteraceae bacterium]
RRTGPPPAAAQEPPGGAVQAPPGDLPHPARSTAPIAPPLAAPQPSWKQELKQEPAAGESTPAPETKPEGQE